MRSINLNDCHFKLTENLELALRYLRNERFQRVFWIDAICINQADSVEREQQVKRMYEIYKNARQVVVWLGATTPDSSEALHFVETIYRCFDPPADNLGNENWSDYPDPPTRLRQVEHLLAPEYASSWVALHGIFSRRWWERAWVLQELIAAEKATFCCGDIALPWSVIGVAILISRDTYQAVLSLDIEIETEFGTSQYDWPAEYIERAFNMLARREMKLEDDPRTSTEVENLSSWLSGNRHRECKTPHDKIYSILGLLNEKLQELIQPNYHVRIGDLYQSVVHAYVRTSSCLDLICHSQHSNVQFEQPSWVPDWSRREKAAIFAEIPPYTLSNASFIPHTKPDFEENDNVLTVQGICLGTIKRVNLEFIILEDLRKQRWHDDICSTETAESTHTAAKRSDAPAWWYFEASAERLFLPAIKNLDPSDEQWETHLELFFDMVKLEWYPSGSDWCENISSSELPILPSKQRLEDFGAFYAHLQGLMKSRTVFETEDLKIGVALDFAEPGDIVCQVLGCSVPLVLRRDPDGNFRFIGDAYVYHFLDGEVLKEVFDGTSKIETFRLV